MGKGIPCPLLLPETYLFAPPLRIVVKTKSQVSFVYDRSLSRLSDKHVECVIHDTIRLGCFRSDYQIQIRDQKFNQSGPDSKLLDTTHLRLLHTGYMRHIFFYFEQKIKYDMINVFIVIFILIPIILLLISTR